jgi:hypothetical protein
MGEVLQVSEWYHLGCYKTKRQSFLCLLLLHRAGITWLLVQLQQLPF